MSETTTEDFGTFEKDGETRVAYGRADAVRYLFEGYREVKDEAQSPSVDRPVEVPGATPPPKAGAGSSTDAWAAFAADRGVPVPPDAKRDEIVVALEAHGIPTE